MCMRMHRDDDHTSGVWPCFLLPFSFKSRHGGAKVGYLKCIFFGQVVRDAEQETAQHPAPTIPLHTQDHSYLQADPRVIEEML